MIPPDSVQVKPQPGDLAWAVIRVPTIAGFVEASFNSTASSFRLTLGVPANTKVNMAIRCWCVRYLVSDVVQSW